MERSKHVIKRFVALALSLIFALSMINIAPVETFAAAAPGKPKITLKAGDEGSSVSIKIGKTKNADGYELMVKKPGSKKFERVTTSAVVKKGAAAKMSFYVTDGKVGEYSFKVRAYRKSGQKKVYGKFSKISRITLSSSIEISDGAYEAFCGVYRCDGNVVAIATDVPCINNYGGYFGILDDYIMDCGALRISSTLYPEGFFYSNLVFANENTLTAYTGAADDHVVDIEFRLEGDTLYYTRTINEDGYQEHLTLEKTDEDPKKLYMDTAKSGSK